MKKGRLIILEGADGCGKDTQADILVAEYGFHKTRLPLYENATGKLVKEMIKTRKRYVSEEVFQMTMAANYIETLQRVIMPKINAGKDVVMTRFISSMLAYGGAFDVDYNMVMDLDGMIMDAYLREIEGFTQIYLEIPLEVSMARIEKRDKETTQKTEDIFENTKVLKKVIESYGEYTMFDKTIDGQKPIHEISREISNYLRLN